MNRGWAGWLGFVVLAGLIFVSSCQAWQADPGADGDKPAAEASE